MMVHYFNVESYTIYNTITISHYIHGNKVLNIDNLLIGLCDADAIHSIPNIINYPYLFIWSFQKRITVFIIISTFKHILQALILIFDVIQFKTYYLFSFYYTFIIVQYLNCIIFIFLKYTVFITKLLCKMFFCKIAVTLSNIKFICL